MTYIEHGGENGALVSTHGGVLSVLGVSPDRVDALVSRLTGDQLVSLVSLCVPAYTEIVRAHHGTAARAAVESGLTGLDLKTDVSCSSSVSARGLGRVAPEAVASVVSGQTFTQAQGMSPGVNSYLRLLREDARSLALDKLGDRASYAALLGLPSCWYGDLDSLLLERASDGSLVFGQRGVTVRQCMAAIAVGACATSWEFPAGSLGAELLGTVVDEWVLRKSPSLSDEFGGTAGRPPGCPSDRGFCYRLWLDSCPQLADLGPWPTGRDLHSRGVRVASCGGEYYGHADYDMAVPVYCVVGAPYADEPPFLLGDVGSDELQRELDAAMEEWRAGRMSAMQSRLRSGVTHAADQLGADVYAVSCHASPARQFDSAVSIEWNGVVFEVDGTCNLASELGWASFVESDSSTAVGAVRCKAASLVVGIGLECVDDSVLSVRFGQHGSRSFRGGGLFVVPRAGRGRRVHYSVDYGGPAETVCFAETPGYTGLMGLG